MGDTHTVFLPLVTVNTVLCKNA